MCWSAFERCREWKCGCSKNDASRAGDVDHKLIELARQIGAKIVTNDFNLNKVATVQGLSVLNVNQLANALKPVVLPGEPMRVLDFARRERGESGRRVSGRWHDGGGGRRRSDASTRVWTSR